MVYYFWLVLYIAVMLLGIAWCWFQLLGLWVFFIRPAIQWLFND